MVETEPFLLHRHVKELKNAHLNFKFFEAISDEKHSRQANAYTNKLEL